MTKNTNLAVNNYMARARIEYYPRLCVYILVDTDYNHLVLQTTSYTLADYWRTRVNACKHSIPYDITDHDRRVSTV